MSIDVKPLQDFKFAVSEFNRETIKKALEEIQKFPRLHQIIVHNRTKMVQVQCSLTGDELHITVTNPKDEEFDVES